MDFTELITDFAERHGIEGLTAKNGATALEIDGIVVTLVAAQGQLTVSAEIGEPPPEATAAFADLLLEASLVSEVFFAKNPETGKYIVVRRLALPMLDATTFDTALETLVNRAETWRLLLADFRPAASAAEVDYAAPAFGDSGFMKV